MLKEIFINLTKSYTNSNDLISELWQEIELNYSNTNRYYHTLSHLNDLLNQLLEVKDEIQNWEAILFTVFYHDIIYNSSNSKNEENSAELARKRMLQIVVPADTIDCCEAQILATKLHLKSKNDDTNYFLDADLSVLGSNWENYSIYFNNIRKEYSNYPNIIYNPGRRKVLKHFLSQERIFKTDYFFNKFERQTILNLKRELELLKN